MTQSAAFIIDLLDKKRIGMSLRPEFYSGRGPKTCDLDFSRLTAIHESIKEYNGKDAADAFVSMVASLKSASATAFLLNFFQLETRGWKWASDEATDREWDIEGASDEPGAHGVGMATIFETVGRQGRDESAEDYAVRGAFLERNGYTLNENEIGWRKLKEGEKWPKRHSSYGRW